MALGALLARSALRIGWWIFSSIVLASNEKLIAVLGLELGPAVSLIEVPLTVRSADHGVQAMVVILAIESAEPVLALIDLRVKLQVTVHIGKSKQVGWLGDINDIVKDGQPQWCNEALLLHKSVGLVTSTISIRVLQNNDPVAGLPAAIVAAIIDSFRDPNPAGMVISMLVGLKS